MKLGRQQGADVVFSFTPGTEAKKKRIEEMIHFARSAGFVALVVMTDRNGAGGKAATFAHYRSARKDVPITYYEDNLDVIKKCTRGNTYCHYVFQNTPAPWFDLWKNIILKEKPEKEEQTGKKKTKKEYVTEEPDAMQKLIPCTIEEYLELWEDPSLGNAVAVPSPVRPALQISKATDIQLSPIAGQMTRRNKSKSSSSSANGDVALTMSVNATLGIPDCWEALLDDEEEEEKVTKKVEDDKKEEASDDRMYHCGDCGLAADLGAIDPNDNQWYCKACWLSLLQPEDAEQDCRPRRT